jgi:hypothetical protein
LVEGGQGGRSQEDGVRPAGGGVGGREGKGAEGLESDCHVGEGAGGKADGLVEGGGPNCAACCVSLGGEGGGKDGLGGVEGGAGGAEEERCKADPWGAGEVAWAAGQGTVGPLMAA